MEAGRVESTPVSMPPVQMRTEKREPEMEPEPVEPRRETPPDRGRVEYRSDFGDRVELSRGRY